MERERKEKKTKKYQTNDDIISLLATSNRERERYDREIDDFETHFLIFHYLHPLR